MQSAKKLVMVDELDREYKRLQRPVDVVAKAQRSLRLSDTLRDGNVADDRKVREYVSALHRYLNTRKELPEEPEVGVNPLSDLPTPRKKRKRGRQQLQWTQY